MNDKNTKYRMDIPKNNNLKAEIVSFLNTDGGNIYLGSYNNGNPIEKMFQFYSTWEELISNWIIDAFSTNLSDLITLYPNEKPFRIEIKKGIYKPYYYKDGEGFNSKGVYVRVSSIKRRASYDEIKRMMIITKPYNFEIQDATINELKFDYLENKFKEKNINVDKYGLLLLTKDNKYNNAALLLSEQNPTITKFAVFQGLTTTTFLDKKEFSGSIMKQIDDVLYFASLSNRNKIIISGKAQRDEYLDYPEQALREAIVNCYCHRDWYLSGDIKIEFFDDRVKIYSPGSLPDTLTFDNIKQGLVAKRNPIIVNALDKVDYIENYATGVRRIFSEYEGFDKQPEFYISHNGVIVTLFNRNYVPQNVLPNVPQNVLPNVPQKLEPRERQKVIINFISNKPAITRNELSKELNVSVKTIARDLEKLKSNDIIEFIGNSKDGCWKVIN